MLRKLYDIILSSGYWLKISLIVGLFTFVLKYKSLQVIEFTESIACSQLVRNQYHHEELMKYSEEILNNCHQRSDHFQSQLEQCFTQRSNQHKVSQDYKTKLESCLVNEVFWKRVTGMYSILFVPLASYLFWSLGQQKSRVELVKKYALVIS